MDHENEDEHEADLDDEPPRRANRPQSEPTEGDFFAALGADVPTFVTCETCKKQAMRSPCYECGEGAAKARREADARDDAFGIPVRYRWANVDAPELGQRVRVAVGEVTPDHPNGKPRTARGAAKAAAAWQGPSVLFQGPSGAGKSSLAVAASRLVPGGALYLHALDLERAHIQAKAGTGTPSVIARALGARLLIIDDLGQDKVNEFNALEHVILKRHEAHAPERGRYARTWLTTGLTLEELDRRFNTGVFRRVAGEGIALHIPLVALDASKPEGK